MVREIVLCERLEGYDTCPDDIIHMEHEGVDSVFILDQMPAGAKQESRLIKLIKNVASRSDLQGKRIVVLLPDTGERYLSAGLY